MLVVVIISVDVVILICDASGELVMPAEVGIIVLSVGIVALVDIMTVYRVIDMEVDTNTVLVGFTILRSSVAK